MYALAPLMTRQKITGSGVEIEFRLTPQRSNRISSIYRKTALEGVI